MISRDLAPAPTTLPHRAAPKIGHPSHEAHSGQLDGIDPLRKAAILVVSLEQPLASQLLAQLDRRRSRR